MDESFPFDSNISEKKSFKKYSDNFQEISAYFETAKLVPKGYYNSLMSDGNKRSYLLRDASREVLLPVKRYGIPNSYPKLRKSKKS